MPALSINEWIELLSEFYDQYGYLTVFLGTLGENTALLGLLLPGNSLALLGAAYARLGTLNLGWVIFLASLGTILGYHIDYLLGRFVLARAASGWSTARLGRCIRLAGRLRLVRRLIAKHGGKAILSFISAPAQDQFIPARYARYVSPGRGQERSISIEKPLEASRGIQIRRRKE